MYLWAPLLIIRVKTKAKQKVSIVTLGCSKNLVDSENIVTQLRASNIDADHNLGDAANDIVIVNTCGFIEAAKQESIDTILAYADQKEKGNLEKLYVTGCLSHRYREELETEIPEVDAFFGTMDLPALLNRFEADYKHELIGERITFTPPHYAYLKISEGCNRTCAFCAIPLMRGKHVSKPIEALVKETRGLAANGVKELILIAQELTYYGLDLYRERKLPDLIRALCRIEGIEWIRLHYAYPSKFPIEVLEVMAEEGKVCNYLDMPLQHASDSVLRAMRRQITNQEQLALIREAREIVPEIALRTTMLVGFPGETARDFAHLCEFVETVKFDRLGVFTYSHEDGTQAHKFSDDVPPQVKEERAETLMTIQRTISEEKNEDLIGSTLKVLIDRKEGGFYYGRSEYDSPEVDNEVIISAEHYLRVGDFVLAKITGATEYDLIAKPM